MYRKERLSSCEGHILTVPPARRARSRRARCLCTLTLLEFLSYFLVLAPRSRLKSSLAHNTCGIHTGTIRVPVCPVCPGRLPLVSFYRSYMYRFWRRALQRVQATLMGPSGSAWLALRSAERRRHEAFCLLLRERRISRIHARSLPPGMNRERDQPLADAEAAYLRAARHAEECRHRCRRARALAAPTSGRRRHHRHHHRACG